MMIGIDTAEQRLEKGEPVWFFITSFSKATERLYLNVPPQQLGEISQSKLYLHPMGKKGKPLKKSYSAYHFNAFSAQLFKSESECMAAYRTELDACLQYIEEQRISSEKFHLERKKEIESLMI